MGRSEAEVGVLAVPEAEQLLAVLLPAPRLLPELGRLHRGMRISMAPARFISSRTMFSTLRMERSPKGQVVVDAGGQLADHAGAEHELVGDHLGIGRGFLHGRDKILGIAHCIILDNYDTSSDLVVTCQTVGQVRL